MKNTKRTKKFGCEVLWAEVCGSYSYTHTYIYPSYHFPLNPNVTQALVQGHNGNFL